MSEPFNFWNEKRAYDLSGFVSCLAEMSDEEFSSYVNSSKNDFVNWIEYSIQNIELAEKIRPLMERDLIKATVSEFINAEQNKLMIGTTKAVQDDSLMQEVMQKNEDFLKDASSVKQEDIVKKDFFENTSDMVKKDEKESTILKSEKERGSKLTLIDLPLLKKNKTDNDKSEIKFDHKFGNGAGHDFIAGLVFGLVIGALITLIVIQLL